MDEATYTITQKRFLRGEQTLTLEGDKLKAEYKRGLSLHEYQFDLRGLLPDPTRIRNIPTVKVVALTLCGLLGLFLLPFGIIAEIASMGESMIGLSMLGFFLLIIGVLGWIPTAKELANVVVFQGPGGRVILWPNLPSKEEFEEFLAVLTARIRSAQSHEQILLRRLRQAGIIDDWQYDQAMELFHQKDDQPDDR